jgi:hypothetical protein
MSTSRKTRSAPRKAAAAENASEPAAQEAVQDLASMSLDASTAYVRGVQMAFEFWKQGAQGWVQFNEAAWKAAGQWMGALPNDSAGLERMEAEVEHVVSPVAASPFIFPAQEATRQAMSLATAAWNDWLSWQGRASGASSGNGSGAGVR